MHRVGGNPRWSGWQRQLTRRSFLGMSLVTAGLSGVSLVGCGGSAQITPTPVPRQPRGLPDSVVPQGLGIDVHFDLTAAANGEIEQLANLGLRFVRLDLLWNVVEQEKGRYNFAPYERLINALTARGIRPFCILAYDNLLYDTASAPVGMEVGPHTDAVRQAFGRFAAAAVAQFRGRGVVWEVWNEPDLPRFWYPQANPDAYMALAQVAVAAMRRADPAAFIVGPALIGLERQYQEAWDYLERCFGLGLARLVDAISVHPYRLGEPESAPANYQRLRSLIARYAPAARMPLPIICSEWGYALTWVSPEQQAAYFVRLYLINLASGLPLSIWYDWRDDGPDPKQQEDNFGIVSWSGQPKPAFFAARTLVRELTGARFAGRAQLASGEDYVLSFVTTSFKKQVVWTTGKPHTLELPASGLSLPVTTMTGVRRLLPIKDGKAALELTGDPQYLKLASG